jgi:hypothetical protein
MGMDPATIALAASVIGPALGGLFGGLTAPEGQELESFRNDQGIDPRTMMGESKNLISDYLEAVMGDAAKPVNLRTTIAPLPSFHGGALPMAIAAPGMDPNRLDPSRQSSEGFTMNRRRLSEANGGSNVYSPSPDAIPTGREAQPRVGGAGGMGEGMGQGDPMAALEILSRRAV